MTCKLYFGMGQTLVLNASYEPLNITSWRRAVILMIKGKAESLEEDKSYSIHSGKKLPTVIRLRSYGVKKPILILGNLYKKKDLLISFKNDLMPTVSSIRECLICNNIGKHFGLKFSLHLKVDTGMSLSLIHI